MRRYLTLILILSACNSTRDYRCQGWCDAHGYTESAYRGGGDRQYSPDLCFCVGPVPEGAAVVGEPRVLTPEAPPAAAAPSE